MVRKGKTRHLSGRNKEQLPRSVVDSKGESIPITKDAGTFIYVAEADGTWPKKHLVAVPIDVPWVQERAQLSIKDLRPGFGMGKLTHVRVLQVELEVELHAGKWGQIRRRVLVEEIADSAALDQAVQEILEGKDD